MYLVTSEEMRRIDRHAIDEIGIPSMVLMENAGRAVAEEIAKLSSADRSSGGKRPPRWLVLAGKGKNGGDGLVCARHLTERGFEIGVVYAADPKTLTGEAARQRDIALKIGFTLEPYAPGTIDWARWDGVVDALVGTGASGAPREPSAALIREANASGLPIVAVDVPSGLDADTGETAEPCIRATLTVALAWPKRGLFAYPGAEAAGRVVVRSIGIPERSARSADVRAFVATEQAMADRLGVRLPVRRREDSHKGTYGHVLVAAGSRGMTGAGWLCAKAALRAGCGLATWAVPSALATESAGRLPEAMTAGIPDEGSGEWGRTRASDLAARAEGKQAVVVGPGFGRWTGDSDWLRELWGAVGAPLVLDADALNMLADPMGSGGFAAWPARNQPAVLTPHPGEMARLCGLSVPEVQRDRIGLAAKFAARHGVVLVLKGARTVIAAPNGNAWVNATGNPGMATGGSGDALAGIIGGLLAQRFDAETAAVLGVYLHGAAGDRAASSRHSPGSLIAGDIIEAL
mgnify:CR=1 FL=1